MPVVRPAVAKPNDSPGLSVIDFFTDKASDVVLVPPSFEPSGDPTRMLGDEAEKKVIDAIKKCGRDIPGIKIICFHGVRVIGCSPMIIREVDQIFFVTYQGRKYVFITEVKCNAIIKKSGQTRKKARDQLHTITLMLGDELNVPTDNLQTHSVWPNMEPTEPCSSCHGRHPSLYQKPVKCRQSGTQQRADPEPDDHHVFKDKFDGDKFSIWIKSVVQNRSLAIKESDFESVLEFVARHCVGVLYDEVVKSFCILGGDQTKLLQRPEQLLSDPTIVYGLGGTGKTISIMARIQQISGNLGPSSRALYVSFENNTIKMVKKKLEACNVDLSFITFANFSSFSPDLKKITEDDTVVQDLISGGYRYIYLDSAEDAGVDWVNKLLKKTLGKKTLGQKLLEWVNKLLAQTLATDSSVDCTEQGLLLPVMTTGDFWITLDPFQGLQDNHTLHRGVGNQLHWKGNLVDVKLLEEGFKLGKFVKLQECFRMPKAMIEHIDSEKVLPTGDLPKAQDVESIKGVTQVNINLPVAGYSSQWLAKDLAEQLHTNMMKRGIHPGHCAVLFDQGAEKLLFPTADGGLPDFIQNVNSRLNALVANKKPGCMLQLSQDMGETLLYETRSPVSSLPSLRMVSERSPSGNIVPAVEETVAYKTERHAEVEYLTFS